MFDEFIRFGARARPSHPAISNGHAHVTYRQLDIEVDQVAASLAAAGIDAGGPVIGIATRDGYRHALLTLACARLGLGTSSLIVGSAMRMAASAGTDAMLIDDGGAEPDAAAAGVVVDDDWFRAALAAPHRRVPERRSDDAAIARVQLSSGTTGAAKAMAVTWAVEAQRIAASSSLHGVAAHGIDSRLLSLVGPETAFRTWAAIWRALGTVLLGPPDFAGLARLLPILAPRTILAAPAQITALLGALPSDHVPGSGTLTVIVTGGRLGRSVADQIAIRMGALVAPTYASSEAGTVASAFTTQLSDDGAVGFLLPGVVAEVVDENGGPIAAGNQGHLRLAGRQLVGGYRDGSTQAFRDGWFYPGDLAAIGDDGLLRILGRADEVINVGGEKVAPEALEELVRSVPGVADVAAFALRGEAGDQPWLAIVRNGEVAETDVARALTLPGLGTVRIAWIEAIPRTPMGKPRREELQAAARRL